MLHRNVSSVSRHLNKWPRVHHRVHILFIYALLALLSISVEGGQAVFSHGTFIAVDYTTDHLIVAADSRNTRGSGAHSDTDCKITVLSRSAIFFQMGTSKGTDRGRMIFDADEIARHSYNSVFSERGQKTIKAVADKWGAEMDEAFRRAYARSGESFLRGTVGTDIGFGGFAVVEESGNSSITMYLAENSYSRNLSTDRILFTHTVTPFAADNTKPLFPFGFASYAEEFARGISPRARAIHEELQNLHLRPNIDGKAYILKTLPESVINWSNEPSIGGPVSVVILQQGNPIRWFAPGACQTQTSQ